MLTYKAKATITGSRNAGLRADFHDLFAVLLHHSFFSVSVISLVLWRSVPLPVWVFKWLKSFLRVISLWKFRSGGGKNGREEVTLTGNQIHRHYYVLEYIFTS